MQLPAKDLEFLADRGYQAEQSPDPGGGLYLVIPKFPVAKGGFTPGETDLMIRIPPQYPVAPLDMWYCDPPIRIAETGQFAPASEVMEPHLGRPWQRFSRHLNGDWRPGMDSLRTFFALIQKELQGAEKI